jgi:hypothetical protein
MKTDALTNPIARAAIEALQNGDQKAWSALFAPDAELYDDGSPRSLKESTRDALGYERFTSIDRVENNGLEFYGFQGLAVDEQDLALAARPRMGAVFESGVTYGADFGKLLHRKALLWGAENILHSRHGV